MTPPTEMATASQRADFQRDRLRSPFDITGKTVRPPPAGQQRFRGSCPLDPVNGRAAGDGFTQAQAEYAANQVGL